jgi:glycosyltransferase involved in cell wall biosynthesis
MTESHTCSDEHVAIIIPCYNAEPTLAATLASALAQDAAIEVIVVDDGSRDGSLAVAREFEPRIRVISGPNHGVSSARNIGIAETIAPWIVFLDADDLLEPGTLTKRLACARASDAEVIICDWMDIVDDGAGNLTDGAHRSVDWSALEANPELAIATHVWATTAAILYHRKLVDRIGGFRPDLWNIQDARFLFDAAYQGARFARSDHIGARYRILPGSLSRRDPVRFFRDILLNGQQIEKAWRASGSLDPERLKAVQGIYDTAGRSLFRVSHPSYFEAVEAQRKLGLPLPLHSRVAPVAARLFGLRVARSLAAVFGRLAPGLGSYRRAGSHFS